MQQIEKVIYLRLRKYVIFLSILFDMKNILRLVFFLEISDVFGLHPDFLKKEEIYWNKAYFSFINLFSKGNISVNFEALHTLKDEKTSKVFKLLFTNNFLIYLFPMEISKFY